MKSKQFILFSAVAISMLLHPISLIAEHEGYGPPTPAPSSEVDRASGKVLSEGLIESVKNLSGKKDATGKIDIKAEEVTTAIEQLIAYHEKLQQDCSVGAENEGNVLYGLELLGYMKALRNWFEDKEKFVGAEKIAANDKQIQKAREMVFLAEEYIASKKLAADSLQAKADVEHVAALKNLAVQLAMFPADADVAKVKADWKKADNHFGKTVLDAVSLAGNKVCEFTSTITADNSNLVPSGTQGADGGAVDISDTEGNSVDGGATGDAGGETETTTEIDIEGLARILQTSLAGAIQNSNGDLERERQRFEEERRRSEEERRRLQEEILNERSRGNQYQNLNNDPLARLEDLLRDRNDNGGGQKIAAAPAPQPLPQQQFPQQPPFQMQPQPLPQQGPGDGYGPYPQQPIMMGQSAGSMQKVGETVITEPVQVPNLGVPQPYSPAGGGFDPAGGLLASTNRFGTNMMTGAYNGMGQMGMNPMMGGYGQQSGYGPMQYNQFSGQGQFGQGQFGQGQFGQGQFGQGQFGQGQFGQGQFGQGQFGQGQFGQGQMSNFPYGPRTQGPRVPYYGPQLSQNPGTGRLGQSRTGQMFSGANQGNQPVRPIAGRP